MIKKIIADVIRIKQEDFAESLWEVKTIDGNTLFLKDLANTTKEHCNLIGRRIEFIASIQLAVISKQSNPEDYISSKKESCSINFKGKITKATDKEEVIIKIKGKEFYLEPENTLELNIGDIISGHGEFKININSISLAN